MVDKKSRGETEMIFNEEEYDLCSDTEIDMLLVDLPFDLIKENLRYQINNPLATNVNYIENVIDKFRVLKEQYGDNDDAVRNINSLIVNFFGFIIQEIDSKFDLSIEVDYNDVQETMEAGEVLYNFLILRYKKNITKFIYKFITKNKKRLVEEFQGQYKKKDVTSNSLKKKIKNKDDVLILSNLPSIIKYIMNLDIEPQDFLSYATNDELYEGTYLNNMILQGRLLGNFVEEYVNLINEDYDYVLDEIQTDVKMKLMKKL
jgi:hypothetical protein